MRVAMQPEGMMERVGMALGMVPGPMGDTWLAQKLARLIMAATRLGLFEALAGGRKTAAEVAARARTDPAATQRLLGVLVTARYLTYKAGAFALTPMTRKWMLKDAATSLHDDMLFQYIEWKLIEGSEEYVRTGRPLDFHGRLTPEEWSIYQRGMRAIAGTNAPEVVKRVPVPSGATALLDIGGSHGYYSVALCRKYSQLRHDPLANCCGPAPAEVLPLPDHTGIGHPGGHEATIAQDLSAGTSRTPG